MEDVLLYFAFIYEGDFKKIYQAIVNKEKADLEWLKQKKEQIEYRYTTIISSDYPESLKSIDAPPFVLFYYGDLNYCSYEAIAMVGMRQATPYGKMMATQIAGKVVEREWVVVSGMAKGIDAYSHWGAMHHQGKTIAVLGSGIDYCYPKENEILYQELKKNDLVMSEYPGDLKPSKEFFPNRNRIVAGLAKKIVVVEANKRSGTMITAGFALDQGKEVYCVPTQMNGPLGCNYLISQGANVLVEIEDLFK